MERRPWPFIVLKMAKKAVDYKKYVKKVFDYKKDVKKVIEYKTNC